MEPLTIAAFGVAAAGFALIGKSIADESGLETQLAVALEKNLDSSALVPVVAVHIRHVEMAPRFQGERLSIRTKYGYRGNCLRCDIARFSPQAPARPKISRLAHLRPTSDIRTQLGSTCLFLLNDHVDPVIRFSVRTSGPRARSVAKTSISLADLSQPGTTELALRSGYGDKPLGRVSVTCELVEVKAQDLLNTLADARADKQKDAYLVSCNFPTVVGELVVKGSSNGDNSDDRWTSGDTSQAEQNGLLVGQRVA
jgi:hypothetical protein